MVRTTAAAGTVPELGRREAERLGQHYIGPEHLLLGLLVEADNAAAALLRAHGLDLATVRTEVDRLVAQGVLPSPRPSDAGLLATLGIDLEAVARRVREDFGGDAYYEAAQEVRLRPTNRVPHAPLGGTPLTCVRALRLAAREASARGQQLGPLHLLLGLLLDAQDPVETDMPPEERRLRGQLGLPDHGAHPVRLLVEARGVSLEQLRVAVRGGLETSR